MFSCEYCKIFMKGPFYRKSPAASLNPIFLIKNNVGWFLPKRFVDLVIVRYLPIIRRNHSNMLLLINLQKPKTCPK